MMEVDDETAKLRFDKLIFSSLRTRTTQMNDAVHLLAH